MRSFNEADKKKKQVRIQIQENPADLSRESISQLEDMIKARLRDGNLPCGSAHKIAQEAGVPKIAVGEIADRIGIRITNCQIGCFGIDKIIKDNIAGKKIDDKIASELETLEKNNDLNCASVFELARKLKLTPMAIADTANLRKMKISHCQLGCF